MTSLLAVAACSSHRGPSAAELSASAASESAAHAMSALQREVSESRKLSFTGTYRAEETTPARSGTIKVFHWPSAARIDVTEAGATVRILVTNKGTFSCKFASGSKQALCVTLATRGHRVPSSLDPGLQHLFTDDIAQLVDHTTVHAAVTPSGITEKDVACFAVSSLPADSDLSAGTYCFSNGLLVSAQFRTSLLQLTKSGPAPKPADFTLPASPAPLRTPSASPSSSKS